MCGSGMIAVMMAHDGLQARPDEIVVAGGMELMSNAPYLLPKARSGLRRGHGQVIDHMFLDGLEDAYERGRLMGTFAEDAAEAAPSLSSRPLRPPINLRRHEQHRGRILRRAPGVASADARGRSAT